MNKGWRNGATKLGLSNTTLGSTWHRKSQSLLSLAESRIHHVHRPLFSLSPHILPLSACDLDQHQSPQCACITRTKSRNCLFLSCLVLPCPPSVSLPDLALVLGGSTRLLAPHAYTSYRVSMPDLTRDIGAVI